MFLFPHWMSGNHRSAATTSLRAELFSSEQLQQHAVHLATRHRIDPKGGANRLLQRLAANDVAVPERVKFGPASEMTRVVRNDEGLMTARRAHAATGANSHYCRFGVFQFLRETSQGSLTMHMIGSYNVRMADTPDGKVLFVVENATGRQSGTRNPITGRGATPDVDRAHSEWFGTIHQRYYWIEDKYQSNLLDDALAWLGVF